MRTIHDWLKHDGIIIFSNLKYVNIVHKLTMNFKKLSLSIKELKKTAYHHYGNNFFSIIKFIYYSIIRINKFIVFEKHLDCKPSEIKFDPGFKIIMPTAEELDKLRSGKNLSREFYYDKIHKVNKCFMVLYKDDIVYIHWVYFKGDYSRFLNLQDKSAEINYITTTEKYRGQHIAARMITYTSNYLFEKGYNKVILVCHEKNPPAIKAFKYAGFKETCVIKSFGPFNQKITI